MRTITVTKPANVYAHAELNQAGKSAKVILYIPGKYGGLERHVLEPGAYSIEIQQVALELPARLRWWHWLRRVGKAIGDWYRLDGGR